MNDDMFRLMELSGEGYCCSQAIVQMGLEAQGRSDPVLIRAIGGLCGGMGTGKNVCGALSGAVCFLGLYLGKGGPEEEARPEFPRLTTALVDWFTRQYGHRYGGIDCLRLLEGNQANHAKRCPQIVLESYLKAVELLAQAGIPLDGSREDA